MNKNIPPLTCGLRYGYDGNGQRVCFGAHMGRPNILPVENSTAIKLSLRRLRFVDGCYDQAGAYWGAPANLWRAVSVEKYQWVSNWDGSVVMDDPRHIEIFVRAATRNGAKCKVWDILPNATFYR